MTQTSAIQPVALKQTGCPDLHIFRDTVSFPVKDTLQSNDSGAARSQPLGRAPALQGIMRSVLIAIAAPPGVTAPLVKN